MDSFANKRVLVLGLESRGLAACRLLRRLGASVAAVERGKTPELEHNKREIHSQGIDVQYTLSPQGKFDLAVISPEIALSSDLVASVRSRGIPTLSEIELGLQRCHCLPVAVTGTNGKSTTAELIERILLVNDRKTLIAGDAETPLCSVVERSRDLAYVILNVDGAQLENSQLFRPVVGVLLNVPPGNLRRFANPDEYARACGRLFQSQQSFDWAIIQSEALSRLRSLGVPVPAKTITFSAKDPEAELHLDRGLILSRLPNWSGPLLDLDSCRLKGPHNAENIMAALAVGHVLRLQLESMLDAVKTYSSGSHRIELVAQINGVFYFNDAKAGNLDALQSALLAVPHGEQGEPNIWLVAAGQEPPLDYHSIGPLLCNRVKRAFLLGRASEKVRAAWALFTPCTPVQSLLEAVHEAANQAVSGDVVLLSPACSNYDKFRDYKELGESFYSAVKSISGGAPEMHHNIIGKN